MNIGTTPRQCIDCGIVEMTRQTQAMVPQFRCEKCLDRIAATQPLLPPQFPFATGDKPKVIRVL